jgi:uncharacterized protein YndB with AHSA1/START domain
MNDDYGIVTGRDTIRFERLFPGPIERVWAYLTESEKRGTWFASGPMELRVGGKAEFLFDHASLSPTKEPVPARFADKAGGVRMYGEITRCEPPHVLAYTFGQNKFGRGPSEDSEVTFELSPQGDKVRLLLTHRRLKDRKALLGVAGGWHTHLAIMADNLEGRVPRPFWSSHERIEKEYEERLKAV